MTPDGKRKVWPTDYGDQAGDKGIRCPKCRCPRSEVVYTRDAAGGRRMRKRECSNCGHQFLTFEKT